MSSEMFNPIGWRFGLLEAVDFVERRGNRYYWRCRCSCGNDVVKSSDQLRAYMRKEQDGKNPILMSCGCNKSKRVSDI